MIFFLTGLALTLTAAEFQTGAARIDAEINRLLAEHANLRSKPGTGAQQMETAIKIYTLREGRALCEYAHEENAKSEACLTTLWRTRSPVGLCEFASESGRERCLGEVEKLELKRDALENRAYR